MARKPETKAGVNAMILGVGSFAHSIGQTLADKAQMFQRI